jgi:PST family polysaccharide transporter
MVFLLSPYIIYLIQGAYELNTIINLKIMSIVIFIGGLNYYFANLGLLTLGYKKLFSKAIIYTGIFNIIISFFLVFLFKDIGASLSLVLSETFLLLYLLLIFKKLRKNIENM